METIDVIQAWTLGPGDTIRADGLTYRVINVEEDDSDIVEVDVECLDSTEGEDFLVFQPTDTVEVLGYV